DYGPLVELAVVATLMVVVFSLLTSRYHPAFVNLVVLLSIAITMIVYSILMNLSILELFCFLWRIVFNSERSRYFLLIFWVCNVLASVGFGIFVNAIGRSSTIHRKFFHLTVSMIYLSGIRYDHDFVWLCGWLVFCMFVIVEVLRYFEVPPWKQALNNFFLAMKDEQDSAVLLTPIFLLLAGVAAIGVGDSVAAIVGSQWGKTKW
ncbi:hypothetical protein Angca_008095, partial [Angiostrongylus cantonensis]